MRWLKNFVKNGEVGQRRAAKHLAWFLAVMLLLTLVVRGSAGATLPRVQTARPQAGEIVQRVRGSATVQPLGSRALEVPEGLTVAGVLASAGQTVEPGDALAQFDVEQLAELLQREQSALREMELNWQLLQRGEIHDGSTLETARRNQVRARQDYDIARAKADAELAALREGLAQAEAAAQAAWNTLQATPQELPPPPPVEVPSSVASEPPPAEPLPEVPPLEDTALPDSSVPVEAAQAPAPGQETALPQGDSLPPETALMKSAPIVQLSAQIGTPVAPGAPAGPSAWQLAHDDWVAKDQAVAAARKALAEGETRAEAAMLAAARAVEDADAALAAAQRADTETRRQTNDEAAKNNISADTLQLDITKKREKINRLQALADDGGQLSAEWAGVVEQLPQPGDTVGSGTGFRLSDSSGGFEAEMWVPKNEAERLKPGDACEVAQAGGNMYYREKFQGAIASVGAADEDGRTRVTLRLPDGEWESGQALDVLAVQETQSHALCVPLSALHSSSSGYYLLVIQEQNSVLGLETVVAEVPVTILAQDEQNAAVEGMLSGEEDVVVQSSKALQGGDRVRMAA